MSGDIVRRLGQERDFMVFVAGDGENALRILSEGERREEAVQEILRLREEKALLERIIASQRRQLRFANERNAERNRQLDALHFVWCTGGCERGMHRFSSESVDHGYLSELLREAETQMQRFRSYVASRSFRQEHEKKWKDEERSEGDN